MDLECLKLGGVNAAFVACPNVHAGMIDLLADFFAVGSITKEISIRATRVVSRPDNVLIGRLPHRE